jgi:signal transduction histidine kinase
VTEGGARRARWPWAVLAGFLGIAAVGTVLLPFNEESVGAQAPYIAAFSMFGAAGATILSRDRRNRIGGLLLYASFTTALSFMSGEVATWLYEGGNHGGLTQWFGLVSSVGWAVGILPVVFLLPLLFPDGRPPSARWRPLLWAIAGSLLLLVVSVSFGSPTVSTSSDTIELGNPLYVEAIGNVALPDAFFAVFYIGLFGVSVTSLFVRYRRSRGVERQQIRWAAFGFLAAFIAINLSDLIGDPTLSAIVGGAGFLAFPIAIGVAVLRYHLYDLDVVVKKTVVYAAFAVFATLVYLALVVGVGTWLGRGSSFLTMVAAVIVALTFQPVRARLTRFANRIVYGRRATPYEVLSEFSERVGGAYADEDVLPRMARVLGEGVGGTRADVWLAIGRELRDVAAWPVEAVASEPVPLADGVVPPIAGADRVYTVEQGGELLGALAVSKPASDPFSSADEKLMEDLAAQAGLVLRNVRLTEELKARLSELKAAQKRIVQAQDHERRRLERNIHDGAQQQLVALTLKLRLAESLVAKDPTRSGSMLSDLQAETQTALDDLRDLARGIYPPLLADKGLAVALEAQLRKAGLPATLEANGVGRFPQDVEAAVYFSCLEALQNVAKYAAAQRVSVTLHRTGAQISFRVKDDGVGFDPATTSHGTGLQGIADRLGALDGTLAVTSEPGRGTELIGRVPAVPVQSDAWTGAEPRADRGAAPIERSEGAWA